MKWFIKDPDATLDFTVDWSLYLGTDTIKTAVWIVPRGLTKVAESVTGALATVWGLGAMTRLGYRLHPGTALVPFLVLALAISHSVQFIKR